MTQIAGLNSANKRLISAQIEQAKTTALKPNTRQDRAKYHLDAVMHLAAQFEVYTKFDSLNGRLFRNPPGRISSLMKRAAPLIIGTGAGCGMIRSLHYSWTAVVDRSRKANKTPILFLFDRHLKYLKELAARSGEEAA